MIWRALLAAALLLASAPAWAQGVPTAVDDQPGQVGRTHIPQCFVTSDVADSGDFVLPRCDTNRNQGVVVAPSTVNGLSLHKTISAATTNATTVKASAGQVYGVVVSNINAAARYLKFYNTASAPTCNSDTVVSTIMLPAGATVTVSQPLGLTFGTGISFCLTTGVADSDNNAVSASEHVVNVYYK